MTSATAVLLMLKAALTFAADHPPLAIASFDTKQGKEFQQQWAKHTGKELVYTNSIGMKMVLRPPGEFMMGIKDGAAVIRMGQSCVFARLHYSMSRSAQ